MNRWLIIVLLALISSILHTALFISPLGERIEPWAADLWFSLRGKIEPPKDVAVIAMDEQSYQTLNVPLNQAWPRELHAKLLEKLKEFEPKRVVFDVLFLGNGTDLVADKKLGEAVSKLPVVLGAELGGIEQSSSSSAYHLEQLLQPVDTIAKGASGTALVSLVEDNGFLRRFFYPTSEQAKDLPTLAEAGAGKNPSDVNLPGHRDFIWYYGPPRTIPTYSFYQVLESEKPLPKEKLKDKVIYVGLSLRTEVGPAQQDTYLTPFYKRGRVFGVEIHATAAQNLIAGTWIKRAPAWAETLILFFITFGLTAAIFSLRPQWATLVTFGTIFFWVAISYLSFLALKFVPGVTLSLIVLPISLLGSAFYHYMVTRRAHMKIEGAFQRYLSPEMAREMARTTKELELGGEKIWATAFFTDIEGFTDISEEMPAEKLSTMLNAYFTEVVDVVFAHKGTLVKFIGDAAFALWGAPVKINNHAEKAVEAAVAMQKAIDQFNSSGRYPTLRTRIGIHTGPMLVGNLGSLKRFDYTAIGDSVNLASRVEGINKYFGTSIIITESVKKEIGNLFSPLPLGSISVAGKREVINLYAILSPKIDDDSKNNWEAALKLWREKDFGGAIQKFEALKMDPRLKKAAELYLTEIEIIKLSIPPDWQGEIRFSKK